MKIEAREETWPLARAFRIARGSRTETNVVVVTVSDGEHTGRGEGFPSRRYNQTPASVLAQIESIKSAEDLNRKTLQKLLPAGAARNAVDCALWDLEAKVSGRRVWELASIEVVPEAETSFTVSLNSPEQMAADASANSKLPILKLKLGGDDVDLARVEAVRRAVPSARLFIDANESWSPEHYRKLIPSLGQLGVELIEQPFPAGSDAVLETFERPIPVCADESCHISADVAGLTNRYDMINVKLDKTGGLTEALRLVQAARAAGLKLLFGCMVSTSLGIAPARILPGPTDHVDLDGAALLSRDREHALSYCNGQIGLPDRALWG